MSSGIWILILNVKWRNRTEQHFHFPPSAGYWEGSEKTSWWCHCSSQGWKHYCSFSFETILLFLFLFMACKFATYETSLNSSSPWCCIFYYSSNACRKVQCLSLMNSLPTCMQKVMELRCGFFPSITYTLFSIIFFGLFHFKTQNILQGVLALKSPSLVRPRWRVRLWVQTSKTHLVTYNYQ